MTGYSYSVSLLSYEELFGAMENKTIDFLFADGGVTGCMQVSVYGLFVTSTQLQSSQHVLTYKTTQHSQDLS